VTTGVLFPLVHNGDFGFRGGVRADGGFYANFYFNLFKATHAKVTKFRGDLEIGEALRIPVSSSTHTHPFHASASSP
jgi:hypothetical protein